MRILRIILGCSFLIFVSVLIVDAQMADPLIPPVPGRPLPISSGPVVQFDPGLGLGYTVSSKSAREAPKRITRKKAVMFVFAKPEKK